MADSQDTPGKEMTSDQIDWITKYIVLYICISLAFIFLFIYRSKARDKNTSSLSLPTTAPAKAATPTTTSAQDSNTDSSVDNVDFDVILTEIAKGLYKNSDISDLGKALGFGPADIGRKLDENAKQGGNSMGTLDLLRTWRNRQTPSTEKAALRSALLEARFDNLAEQYFSTPVSENTSSISSTTNIPGTRATTPTTSSSTQDSDSDRYDTGATGVSSLTDMSAIQEPTIIIVII